MAITEREHLPAPRAFRDGGLAAGAFEGMITGRYLPGGRRRGPSRYLEPADQRQAGCDVQDHPGAERARVTRAVRGMPTAGQGVLPAEGFCHEPATTVPLFS